MRNRRENTENQTQQQNGKELLQIHTNKSNELYSLSYQVKKIDQ